jgi:iron complex transport system substrate-binding protein
MKCLILLLISFLSINSVAYPVTVTSCDRKITFEKPPTRAVSNDLNMTEMLFALDLQSQMAGYSGVTGWHKVSETFLKQAKGLPQLSEKYPNMELLLSANTDFFFAGWNYGLKAGDALTPSNLARFGIPTYELTESCIHIMKKQPASFDDIYTDLFNLGKIFGNEARAKKLITNFQQQVIELEKSIAKSTARPVVFLYDSGVDAPFTGGRYAIINAMIETAGGINSAGNINASWKKSHWEHVASSNPELIIIVDYGEQTAEQTAEQKKNFLLAHPALKAVPAIKNKQFLVLEYAEITPGIRVFDATQKIAQRIKQNYSSQSNK